MIQAADIESKLLVGHEADPFVRLEILRVPFEPRVFRHVYFALSSVSSVMI